MKISEAQGLLNSVYVDWAHVLANPNGIRRGSQITWDNYRPQVLKHPLIVSDVIDLFDKGQYTFQVVIDGSLIQIYYQYDLRGNELKSASLAFYSSVSYDQLLDTDENIIQPPNTSHPDLITEEIDIETPDGALLSTEYSEETLDVPKPGILSDRPISWLRIDYDPEHAKGVLHHNCHMHLSAFPHARLVVAGVPTPKQFIEFIMALCYPAVYQAHRLDQSGQYISEEYIKIINSTCVPWIEHNVFSQMAHFRVPIISEGRGS